jgi:hypothetical protein
MPDSTLSAADYQYLRAFRELFPTRLLKRAVAVSGPDTRNRKLPRYLLLGILITWFIKPVVGLPAFVRLLLRCRDRAPADPSIYLARARLGWAPLRWLHEHVVQPLACRQRDPDAFYQGMRLLGIDGTTLTVADTAANVGSFQRAKNQHRASGYPLVRIVALCEVGTHALIDWVMRGYQRSEQDLAARLLLRVPAGTLLLADRNFHSFDLWQTAQQGGYELLIRVQKGPKLPINTVLPDGSYLSVVYPRRGKHKKQRAITVRVIRYGWIDEKGQRHEARLVTSLLDALAHPAAQLVELYHRRWEQELVFREIKGHLAGRQMHIRAEDPLGVCQEVEALLLGHYTLRWVMLQAARKAGVPAVTLSFTESLRVLEVRLIRIAGRPAKGKRSWSRWWGALLRQLGQEQLRPRGKRRCPRARKVTRSHWPTKKGQQEGTIPKLEIVPAATGLSP